MIKISPSVLACDFAHMADDVKRVEDAGVEYLHLDVMDGMFVPNISFGVPVITSLRPCSKLVFDTHLMIEDPIRYVEVFKKAGADILTVHYEACPDVRAALEAIRAAGMKAGISVKPKTPVSVLAPYLDVIDLILIMSVEPGFGGQSFMPESLPKLAAARTLAMQADHVIEIEVDGGISPKNASLVVAAGADVLVAGSAVFHAADVKAAVDALKNAENVSPL